jgi:hypothetical protein
MYNGSEGLRSVSRQYNERNRKYLLLFLVKRFSNVFVTPQKNFELPGISKEQLVSSSSESNESIATLTELQLTLLSIILLSCEIVQNPCVNIKNLSNEVLYLAKKTICVYNLQKSYIVGWEVFNTHIGIEHCNSRNVTLEKEVSPLQVCNCYCSNVSNSKSHICVELCNFRNAALGKEYPGMSHESLESNYHHHFHSNITPANRFYEYWRRFITQSVWYDTQCLHTIFNIIYILKFECLKLECNSSVTLSYFIITQRRSGSYSILFSQCHVLLFHISFHDTSYLGENKVKIKQILIYIQVRGSEKRLGDKSVLKGFIDWPTEVNLNKSSDDESKVLLVLKCKRYFNLGVTKTMETTESFLFNSTMKIIMVTSGATRSMNVTNNNTSCSTSFHIRLRHSSTSNIVETVTSVTSVTSVATNMGLAVDQGFSGIFVVIATAVVAVVVAAVAAAVINVVHRNHRTQGAYSHELEIGRMSRDERDIGNNNETSEWMTAMDGTWKRRLKFKFFNDVDVQFEPFYTLSSFLSNKSNCVSATNTFEYDKFDAYKGIRLYALPVFANLEHSVLEKNFLSKGLTVCQTRLSLTTFTSCNKYFLISFNDMSFLYKICTFTLRHSLLIKRIKLMNDIEVNPGPNTMTKLKVITANCRGLGNIEKFRLLLNKVAKCSSKQNTVALLQETMVIDDSYVKMAWRGHSVVTPGTGNSKGCITLLNSDTIIENVTHLGDRGHYFTYKHNMEEPIVIFNIYAPNGFNAEKTDFFANIFDIVSNLDCDVIMGGDFNVTLDESDRLNRGATPGELELARYIKESANNFNLEDVWHLRSGFTWRKRKQMSKLDRIFTRLSNYDLSNLNTEWTFTTSDHAAVITEFVHKVKTKHRSAHTKLENDIVKNVDFLNELRQYVVSQLNDPNVGNFNPHAKLEFAKVCIRTKALEIIARERRKESTILRELNADIALNTKLLARYADSNSQDILARELDLAINRRNEILQKQGEKLAAVAKMKWYNEGEKSNKYFLNLLKRQTDRNEMTSLLINGVEVTNDSYIKNYVKNFYQELYNHNRATEIANDLFEHMFTVEQADNDHIKSEITLAELWATLKPLKATTPGPDGISNLYLKKLWDIMGPLILDSWKYSMRRGELPPSHRNSILRLIPKAGKNIKELKNWRPITLSNCDHKLITKTYNN